MNEPKNYILDLKTDSDFILKLMCMANFGKDSDDNNLGNINVADIAFNGSELRDRLKRYDTSSVETNVTYRYNKHDKKLEFKVKDIRYFSVGNCFMNGLMLPKLDLFGSNFAFYVDNKENVKSFIDLTLVDYEFTPRLRLKDKIDDLFVEMN